MEDYFKKYKNVNIVAGDFYSFFEGINKFDIIHIDISNDGDVYEFAVKNYLSKTNKLRMLEGGSKDRDKVDWMINFTKRPINPYLEKISNNLNVEIIQKYPSMTLIRK